MGKKKPDTLALVVGHAAVGIVAAYATAKVAKAIGPSILLGVIAILLHAELDAPVSQALSDAGL
jgi:hypothetical protein